MNLKENLDLGKPVEFLLEKIGGEIGGSGKDVGDKGLGRFVGPNGRGGELERSDERLGGRGGIDRRKSTERGGVNTWRRKKNGPLDWKFGEEVRDVLEDFRNVWHGEAQLHAEGDYFHLYNVDEIDTLMKIVDAGRRNMTATLKLMERYLSAARYAIYIKKNREGRFGDCTKENFLAPGNFEMYRTHNDIGTTYRSVSTRENWKAPESPARKPKNLDTLAKDPNP
jgi:hypothetical protein